MNKKKRADHSGGWSALQDSGLGSSRFDQRGFMGARRQRRSLLAVARVVGRGAQEGVDRCECEEGREKFLHRKVVRSEHRVERIPRNAQLALESVKYYSRILHRDNGQGDLSVFFHFFGESIAGRGNRLGDSSLETGRIGCPHARHSPATRPRYTAPMIVRRTRQMQAALRREVRPPLAQCQGGHVTCRLLPCRQRLWHQQAIPRERRTQQD
jgi:hypothetical protein